MIHEGWQPAQSRPERGRWLGRTAVLLSIVLALAACGVATTTPGETSPGEPALTGRPTDTPAATADPNASVNLTFFHYAGSNQEIIPSRVISEYMAAHAREDGTYPVQVARMEGSNARTYPGIVAAYKATGTPTVQCGYYNPDASTKGDLEDLWEPLDLSRLPNAADIPEQYIREGNRGIAWGVSALGIAYRTDLVDPPPTSWLDLLDPEYRGRVGLPDAPLAFTFGGMIAINQILGGDESESMDLAFEAFREAAEAGQFHSIFPGNQALKDLMVAEQVHIVGYSYGNVAPWGEEGLPIGYVVPEEGQIAFPLYFQILKGGTPEQIEHCYGIINELLAPETLAEYAALTNTAPTNPNVPLPPELVGNPVFDPANIVGAIQIDWTAVAENTTEWLDRWQREIAANLE